MKCRYSKRECRQEGCWTHLSPFRYVVASQFPIICGLVNEVRANRRIQKKLIENLQTYRWFREVTECTGDGLRPSTQHKKKSRHSQHSHRTAGPCLPVWVLRLRSSHRSPAASGSASRGGSSRWRSEPEYFWTLLLSLEIIFETRTHKYESTIWKLETRKVALFDQYLPSYLPHAN